MAEKIDETTVQFFSKQTIESMDRLAIIQEQNIFETTVTSSRKKTIASMGD